MPNPNGKLWTNEEIEKVANGDYSPNVDPETGRVTVPREGITVEEMMADSRVVSGGATLTIPQREKYLEYMKSTGRIKDANDSFWHVFMNPTFPYLDQSDQALAWSQISKYPAPTDTIELSNLDAAYISGFWFENQENQILNIPSDLILAKTVPLPNFEVQVKFTNVTEKYRFILFEGWENTVESMLIGSPCAPEMAVIGAFIMYPLDGNGAFYVPIAVDMEHDFVLYIGGGWHIYNRFPSEGQDMKAPPAITYGMTFLEESLHWVPQLWYGIQLSLLNPLMSDIYESPAMEQYIPRRTENAPEHRSSNKKGKKKASSKRKVYSVRKHVIKLNAYEDAMKHVTETEEGEKKTYNRKTMSWWVIGHWRTCSDGRRTFVKGHWRGPLRSLKKNTDAGRDRKISIPE